MRHVAAYRLAGSFFSLALWFSHVGVAGAQPEPASAAFDGAMRQWMAQYAVPRGSIAVMHDNRLVFAAGYGGRGPGERVSVWSLSKAITAFCVASLIRDGKLLLDNPLGPLLAAKYREVGRSMDGRLGTATVGQLLSHRSGLPHRIQNGTFAPGLLETLRTHTTAEARVAMLMPAIAEVTASHSPGSQYEYSNVGYLLLGQIIEQLTGTDYATTCGNRVLAKAGIAGPTLDPLWGNVLHSAGGWKLSGPEYLSFVRLMLNRQPDFLPHELRAWLETADGKWISDKRDVGYTLGTLVRPIPGRGVNLFHSGSWAWRQADARSGPINERRGSYVASFWNGSAWFASFDGIGDGDDKAYGDLDAVMWKTTSGISTWPINDKFASFGVGSLH